MKKRSKSLSLSDKLLEALDKILKEERRKALETNSNRIPNLSSLVEEMLWKIINERNK